MSAWQPILNEFKKQFKSTGLEDYQGSMDNAIQNFNAKTSTLAQGANEITGVMARNAAESRAAAEANKKQNETYKRTYNASGGYDFTDPNGNKITPWQYSLATQTPLQKTLEGSYDQKDINFLTDYQAMTADLALNKTPLNEGLKIMATDYPDIFYGQGGNTSRYQMQPRKELITQAVNGINKSAKKTNIDKEIVKFSERLQSANNRAEAEKIRDEYMRHTFWGRDANKEKARNDIYNLVDMAFPTGPSAESYYKNLPQ